jgi:hypothetical protein
MEVAPIRGTGDSMEGVTGCDQIPPIWPGDRVRHLFSRCTLVLLVSAFRGYVDFETNL